MTDLITINPDQLALATVAPANGRVMIYVPGGPLQGLPLDKLLAKLIKTDLLKTTKALLDADLVHVADQVALVYNDPTALNNGWYRKTGASGAGAWVQFEVLAKAAMVAVTAAVATATTKAGEAATSAAAALTYRDAAAGFANYFISRAAGAAATATNGIFTSDEEGQLAWYRRTPSAPNYLFLDFVASGDSGGGVAPLFTSIGTITVAAAILIFRSAGYSASGIGAGDYINDALATSGLAAAHPYFCKIDAGGRYWRLMADTNGRINPRQCGEIGGAGINAQPKVQATAAYACAMERAGGGIRGLDLLDDMDLWSPAKTSNNYEYDPVQTPIPITAGTSFTVHGRVGGTLIQHKNSTGGTNATTAQTVNGAPWRGGALLWVMPDLVATSGNPTMTMDYFGCFDLVVDGGYTLTNINTNAGSDVHHKGFRLQGATIGKIEMDRCEWRNFAGEIFYTGGSTIGTQIVRNSWFHGSQQCAFNPNDANLSIYENVKAGRSYQAVENIGGRSAQWINCHIYDFYSSGISGGPDPSIPVNYPFNYTVRRTDARPPMIHIDNMLVEGATDALYFGAFVHGKLKTMDSTITINYTSVEDVQLDIEAWCDQKSAFSPLFVSGPPTATTQFQGAPVGIYYDKTRSLQARVNCQRTEYARSTNKYFNSGVNFQNGLIDRDSCRFLISGEAHKVFEAPSSPVAGFSLPKTIVAGEFRSTSQPYGYNYDTPSTNTTYKSVASGLVTYNGSGTPDLTLGNALDAAEDQEFTFWKGEAGGCQPWFRAADPNFLLRGDCQLTLKGHYLKVKRDTYSNKWAEVSRLTA